MTHDRDRIDEIQSTLRRMELHLRVIRAQQEITMATIQELMDQVAQQGAALGNINTQTTRLGEQVENVANDITELIGQLPTAGIPDELMAQVQAVTSGLTAAAGTLTTVADALEQTAAQWPPQA